MKSLFNSLILVSILASVVGCCDRRCSVQSQKQAEPINLQDKLIKMKEQAGGKGPK